MVIIEGPDGGGKTSLGRHLLRDKIVRQVLQSPNRTKNKVPLVDQTNRYRAYFPMKMLAVDRYLWSERVYGPIIRGGSQIDTTTYQNIVVDLMRCECPIVFCLPYEFETLNIETQTQMPGVREKLKDIYVAYCEYANTIRDYKYFFRYDWSAEGSYNVLKTMLKENING